VKKQSRIQSAKAVPAFATEAEEAAWWYENQEKHGSQLATAVEHGEARLLTRDKLLERIAASTKERAAERPAKRAAPVVALRIPEDDLALARKQAERKGLPYQTYIKSLLHETLMAREKQKRGWD